jgi:hypothetical protein
MGFFNILNIKWNIIIILFILSKNIYVQYIKKYLWLHVKNIYKQWIVYFTLFAPKGNFFFLKIIIFFKEWNI